MSVAGLLFDAKLSVTLKQQFENIYAANTWQHGSGEGSLPVHTAKYRLLVEDFIREHKIRTVLDFGCGDWQSSCLMNWEGVRYFGYDIVPSVIEANRAKYQKAHIEFHVFTGDFDSLPSADLLIVKDVLQHWSNASVLRFLPVLKRYPYALITNCVKPLGRTINRDIEDGDFRYLDLCLPPFEVAAKEIGTFTNHRSFFQRLSPRPRWKKKVLLVKSPSCAATS